MLGWAMRELQNVAILPAGLLNHYGPEHDTFRPDEAVELICEPLSLQDMSYVIEPLKSLQDVDKRIEIQRKAEQGWEQTDRKRVDEITRDAYLSIESNLYVIHPEMSHVSREFAAGDPGYWIQK